MRSPAALRVSVTKRKGSFLLPSNTLGARHTCEGGIVTHMFVQESTGRVTDGRAIPYDEQIR